MFKKFRRKSSQTLDARRTAPDLWVDKPPTFSVAIPLSSEFRFAHEPIQFRDNQVSQHNSARRRFVGRERELREFIQRIILSDGGAFLITGYRGIGKTSFVNRAVQDIKENLPLLKDQMGRVEIIDIYLNLARPVTAGELMHHIVRSLYTRLDENKILPLLDAEVRNALLLAYQRTSMNMTRKSGQTSERGFGLSDLAIGLQAIGANAKLSASTKRSRSESLDMSFLAYEDKAAEHDIIHLSNLLLNGYVPRRTIRQRLSRIRPERLHLKIIFVFDELDKLEDFTQANGRPVIDEILNALKNLFTTSGMSFVFVGGKDFQERWTEDIGKGDSVYESVFAFHRYLPAMWADVNAICDNLVDVQMIENDNIADPAAEFASILAVTNDYEAFKQYLAFKGRGIPRSILRTLNQYVHWDGQRPFIAFERHELRRMRSIAQLQLAIEQEQEELWGDVREEMRGEWRDKRMLETYYLVDWILLRGERAFSMREAVAAVRRLSSKIAPSEEAAEDVVYRIVNSLLKHDYLETIQPGIDQAVVGDVNAVAELQYRIPKRRIVEMGSFADEHVKESIGPTPLSSVVESEVSKFGQYQVLQLIAKTGASEVYRAWDSKNNREVTIKYQKYPEEGYSLRFRREAYLLTHLNHPNLIRGYDFGESEGHIYIVMEFIDGPSLSDVLAQVPKLDLSTALAILRPIAEAVGYLHNRHVIRCDVKPSNILIARAGRVIDLGIVRAQIEGEPQRTQAGMFIGTMAYSAPEQLYGGDIDARVDIYALGVVLYEMLTGRRPFPKPDAFQANEWTPLSPRDIEPSIPANVEQFMVKCLARNPNERFQTIGDFLESLPTTFVVNLAEFTASIIEKQNQSLRREEEVTEEDISSVSYTPSERISVTQSEVAYPHEAAIAAATSSVDESIGILILAYDSPLANPTYPLHRNSRTTIGRSADNVVVIEDVAASRYHAVITRDQSGQCQIKDLNTANGTFVNDRHIIESPLVVGDRVRIGKTIFILRRELGLTDGGQLSSQG